MFALNMATTRGCPYSCNWCAKPIWGQSYAVRSPANVVAELKTLIEAAAPDYIWFMDDIMGLKPKWWGAFADELERNAIRIRFKCLSRADLVLREGAVADLARAGCDIVWLGAESGSQKILDAMDKGLTVEQIEEATRRLKAAGIRVGHFIQFGYSGEGVADIARTIGMIRRTQPDEIGISVSYPLPGTAFYDRVKAELHGKRNWSDSERPRDALSWAVHHRLLSPPARLCASRFQDAPGLRAFARVLKGRETLRYRHVRSLVYAMLCLGLMPFSLLILAPAAIVRGPLDILLTHGYFLAEDEVERRVMKPYPPLGLLYISSHLKALGFSVEILDTTFRTVASALAALDDDAAQARRRLCQPDDPAQRAQADRQGEGGGRDRRARRAGAGELCRGISRRAAPTSSFPARARRRSRR